MVTTLSENIKNKILEFIDLNELDFDITDNKVARYQLTSYDGVVFYIQENNEQFLLIKHHTVNGSDKFEYYQYEKLNRLLESLSSYDQSLEKTYWMLIQSDAKYGVVNENYNPLWSEDITGFDYKVEENLPYNYVCYEDFNYKPEIKSPYNTLHEVSPINELQLTVVEKLYFEIHPVNCKEKNETYIFKLLCNNEEIFKEYVNYLVYTKKGLTKLIDTVFTEMEQFKTTD